MKGCEALPGLRVFIENEVWESITGSATFQEVHTENLCFDSNAGRLHLCNGAPTGFLDK